MNQRKYKCINVIKIKNNEFLNYINDNDYLRGSHNQVNGSIAISMARYLNINNEKIKILLKILKGYLIEWNLYIFPIKLKL